MKRWITGKSLLYKTDGKVKSPSAVLRCILGFARLASGTFYLAAQFLTFYEFIKTLLLIFFVLLLFGGTSPVQARADQFREESEMLPGVKDRILAPKFSSPPQKRNSFSPPLTTKPSKSKISKKITLPDNIKLTGTVNNKLGKSAIIEISGESYLVQEGDSITVANQELRMVKLTDKEVIIGKGKHFFALMFLSQAK